MTSNIKKIYTKEFKATAVKLVLEGDKMVLEAVKKLVDGSGILYKWVEQVKLDDEKDSKNIKLLDQSSYRKKERKKVTYFSN